MVPGDTSNSAYSFVLERADLYSPYFKGNRFLDIKNFVTDIDLFESINKPYMTGTLVFVDDKMMFSLINFQGIETITLELRLPEKEFKSIVRTFYIDRVVKNSRANDTESVIMLHLTEDIGFVSQFININRAFKGRGSEIISTVFKDYFKKDITIVDAENVIEAQEPFQVVVPNLNPIQTVEWVKDRITADNGAPYYLYSTLYGPKNKSAVLLKNWQTMITQSPRTSKPFTYSQADTNKNKLSIDQEMFLIDTHYDNEPSDIMDLNDNGFVNSKFMFHDVNTNTTYIPGYDQPTMEYGAQRTLPYGKRWTAKGMFENNYINGSVEKNIFNDIDNVYPSKARLPYDLNLAPNSEDDQLNPLLYKRPEGRVIANVYSRFAFDGINSYADAKTDAEHLLKINSKALRNWSVTAPLTVSVPGRLFLNGSYHATVGVKYNWQFIGTLDGYTPTVDPRRSGEYVVFSTRHSFTRDNGYRVYMTGVGLTQRSLSDKDIVPANPPPPGRV